MELTGGELPRHMLTSCRPEARPREPRAMVESAARRGAQARRERSADGRRVSHG